MAPRDGTMEDISATLGDDIIFNMDMDVTLDINVNDMEAMATGRRTRHAVGRCHSDLV